MSLFSSLIFLIKQLDPFQYTIYQNINLPEACTLYIVGAYTPHDFWISPCLEEKLYLACEEINPYYANGIYGIWFFYQNIFSKNVLYEQ